MKQNPPTLLVVTGPTAVGKTSYAVRLAQQYDTVVLSADSRQIYRGMEIATAQPTGEERQGVKHYFIGEVEATDTYSAGRFEREALAVLDVLFQKHRYVVVAGGTGLYIRALIHGFDEHLPADAMLRAQLTQKLHEEGKEALFAQLQRLDPDYAAQVDPHNPHRLIRALEVCITAGVPYSALRKNQPRPRPFQSIVILLQREREDLYERINRRVLQMMNHGLLEEARKWYPQRHLQATQTVGYKELFQYFDGKISLDEAVKLIQRNTRHFAKRQLTWFRKMEYDILIDAADAEAKSRV